MILIIKLLLKMRSYISKMEISYCHVQSNHLPRTAIETEILFAPSSMAELIVVYFYIIMISKYWQSAAQSYNHRHPWREERKN